ncbi:MAG: hypothetical protein FWD32_01425, partial [Firmicutes bacterium]|nr:hypothetical protein [Bacillota bacterium]
MFGEIKKQLSDSFGDWKRQNNIVTKKDKAKFFETLTETEKKYVKELIKREKPGKFLLGLFSIIFLAVLPICLIILAIMRGTMYDSIPPYHPFGDALFLIGFFGFITIILGAFIFVFLELKIKRKICLSIIDGKTATGIVTECVFRLGSTSTVSARVSLSAGVNGNYKTIKEKRWEKVTYKETY